MEKSALEQIMELKPTVDELMDALDALSFADTLEHATRAGSVGTGVEPPDVGGAKSK